MISVEEFEIRFNKRPLYVLISALHSLDSLQIQVSLAISKVNDKIRERD